MQTLSIFISLFLCSSHFFFLLEFWMFKEVQSWRKRCCITFGLHFFFFPGHNSPQVQLCLRQQWGRAGQSPHWHFWESFALQKTGLAMPDPELGRQGLNPQGSWQGKPLWFICSSEKDEAAQENNWVMQEQILEGQGVWGKGEGDTKVFFPSDTFLPQFGQKNLGRTLRRERRFHSSWGWEKLLYLSI